MEDDMSDGYVNAPATKLLATNCLACGRPLVDAISVSVGLGPECREGFDGGISEDKREAANGFVFRAAIAAQEGRVYEVMALADKVQEMGLVGLAEKVRQRFTLANAKAEITIEEKDGKYIVDTPFRRKDSDAFINAWRAVPGRRWVEGKNVVPVESKKELWSLLQRFFGGRFAKGPKGAFRIPKAEPVVVQEELNMA
jgi:hypothetical protein